MSNARSTSGRRRRPAPPPAFPTTPIIAVAGVVIVVVLVFVMTMDGGGLGSAGSKTENVPAGVGATPAKAARRADEPGRERSGTAPTEAAPDIPDAAFAQADKLFGEASDLWTAAQRQRQSGDTAEYGETLRTAWRKLEELTDSMSPYTDWFEQADLEGWAMPAAYDRLQKRLNRWDPLRRKVQKLKPAGR